MQAEPVKHVAAAAFVSLGCRPMELHLNGAVLRPWRKADLEALVEAANNRNVSRTLRDRFPFPYTRDAAEAFLAKQSPIESEIAWCIEVEGRVAGGLGLHRGSDVSRLTAELGYWLAEPFWGRGIATAAVRAAVPYAFATLPLERIEAYAFANNPASIRVLEKAGFTCEGRLRRSVIKGGEILDSLVYSVLRGEMRD